MDKTVTALPNQSMLDIIAMQYGTLEAGMGVMAANSTDISHIPVPGSQWTMPVVDDAAIDKDTVAYLKQNEIVIGTLALPPLTASILLKPVMRVTATASGLPHVLGYYAYNFFAAPGFINVNPLVEDYLTNNPVNFQTVERYVTVQPVALGSQLSVTPMPAETIPYKLTWTVGLSYMMVWSDLSLPVKTATFKDTEGNTAYVAPVFLLDNISEDLIEYYMADALVDIIAAAPSSVTVRITRSHPHVMIADFTNLTMSWIEEAVGGTPDPDDPTNPDKIMLTLGAGTHTIGVKTSYQAVYFGAPVIWPSSAFTMVIGVS